MKEGQDKKALSRFAMDVVRGCVNIGYGTRGRGESGVLLNQGCNLGQGPLSSETGE